MRYLKNVKFARKIVLTLIKKNIFVTMYFYYNERDLNTFFKQHFYLKTIWKKSHSFASVFFSKITVYIYIIIYIVKFQAIKQTRGLLRPQ